jgi:hypothetical protein
MSSQDTQTKLALVDHLNLPGSLDKEALHEVARSLTLQSYKKGHRLSPEQSSDFHIVISGLLGVYQPDHQLLQQIKDHVVICDQDEIARRKQKTDLKAEKMKEDQKRRFKQMDTYRQFCEIIATKSNEKEEDRNPLFYVKTSSLL